MSVALLVLALVSAPPPSVAECSQRLGTLEAELRARPDDLFLGADYRQGVLACSAGDRATRFLDGLARAQPRAASAWLNAGLAYVDRIPPASDLRQALLGKAATERLGQAVRLRPSWLGHHVRGFVYLFYPRAFGTARRSVAELEAALRLSHSEPRRPCHARTYVALGDVWYWRLDDLPRARRIWAEGLALFPDDVALRSRVGKQGMPLRDAIRHSLNADRRIDTSLAELRD